MQLEKYLKREDGQPGSVVCVTFLMGGSIETISWNHSLRVPNTYGPEATYGID